MKAENVQCAKDLQAISEVRMLNLSLVSYKYIKAMPLNLFASQIPLTLLRFLVH